MQRDVCPQIGADPLAHLPDLALAVVQCWHHEVDDLQPLPLALHELERVQHRRDLGNAVVRVELLRDRLQVDLHRIEVGEKPAHWLPLDVAVGDHHRADSLLVPGLRRVQHVLVEDHRLAVCVGDGLGAIPRGARCDLTWGQVKRALDLLRSRLGDLPVLAVLAVEVAARCGNGERRASRQEVEQGLLLDGVQVQRCGLAVAQRIVRPPTVLLVPAVPPLPVAYDALLRADTAAYLLAAQPVVVHRLPEGLRLPLANCARAEAHCSRAKQLQHFPASQSVSHRPLLQ